MVKFEENCRIYYTYSSVEYNRSPIYISQKEYNYNKAHSILTKLQNNFYSFEDINIHGSLYLYNIILYREQKELKEKIEIANKEYK